MKLYRRLTLVVIATVTGLSSLLLAAAPVHAAAGTVYFTPGSGRFDPGSTFTIDVKTTVQNPGTILGGARVSVTYPANMVSVQSTSTSGNSMGGSISKTTGQLSYSAVVAPPRYGTDLLLFRVTFKALATGNVTLNFTSASQVNDGPTTKQSSTYSIQPASCPAGKVGTPPNCTTPPPAPTPKPTPKPTPAPTPAPTPTPSPTTSTPTQAVPEPSPDASTDITPVQTDAGDLSIKDVTAKPSWQENTIGWTSSLPDVTSTIEIGTSKEALEVGPEVEKQEDGSLLATMKDLLPGTRYYYLLTAASKEDPAKKATYSGALTTRGYPVMLIVNQDDAPIQGAKITIDKGSYVTDKSGSVLLELANKSYTATITGDDGATKTVTFAVAKKDIPTNGSDPEMQKFSFGISATDTAVTTNAPPIGLIVGSILGGLALIGGFFLFLLYRRNRNEQLAVPVSVADEYAWTQSPTPDTTPVPDYSALPEEQQYTQVTAIEQEYPYAPEQQNTSQISPDEQLLPSEYTSAPDEQYPTSGEFNQTVPIVEESQPIEMPLPPDTLAPSPVLTTEPEQLSPQVTEQVLDNPAETTSPVEMTPPTPPTTEPGAIYDPSTGELDIIHHTAKPTHSGGLN